MASFQVCESRYTSTSVRSLMISMIPCSVKLMFEVPVMNCLRWLPFSTFPHNKGMTRFKNFWVFASWGDFVLWWKASVFENNFDRNWRQLGRWYSDFSRLKINLLAVPVGVQEQPLILMKQLSAIAVLHVYLLWVLSDN